MLHSFVIPVFNEQESLHALEERLKTSVGSTLEKRGERYEIVFVNDGSRDRSLAILEDLYRKDPEHIRCISFSRNFGHQAAITAGLDFARGDTATILDADLQDPPEAILSMIDRWKEGYDIVYGVREKRQDESAAKKITALLFYRLLRNSTHLEIPLDAGDFRLMSRKALEALKQLPERHRFMRGLSVWIGFKQTSVTYVREKRFAGETKYPIKKMIRLAWDAFTGFSLVPLQLATVVGLLAAGGSALAAFWALYIRFFTDKTVQGWTSLIIAVLFLGGVQLLSIGVLGEYVGRIFEESKRRPLYLVDQIMDRDRC